METWRQLPEYEGLYDVSNLGRVRSWKAWRGQPGPRILRPTPNEHGYPCVSLFRDGKRQKTAKVHQLVMLTFVGPPGPGMQVAHKDGNRMNSALTNLRYCTPAENTADKWTHGTMLAGDTAPMAKLTSATVLAIRNARCADGTSFGLLARTYGVDDTTVADIVHGVLWPKAGGPIESPASARVAPSAVDVAEIRRMYGTRSMTQRQLAAMYGLSEASICRIVKGRRHAAAGGPLTHAYRKSGGASDVSGRVRAAGR